MSSRCGPPEFDDQDWSQFDFSHWHLDGVKLDTASAAAADLAQRLFISDEWRAAFQGGLPDLQGSMIDGLRQEIAGLQAERKAVLQQFETRSAAFDEQRAAYEQSVQAAAAPPAPQAVHGVFQLGVRVAAEDPAVGLPGVTVVIVDPRKKNASLAEAVTDRNGNAILAVSGAPDTELDKTEASLEARGPDGKVLQRLAGAVFLRAGQVETRVVSLKASAAVTQFQQIAGQLRLEGEILAKGFAARSARLAEERDSRIQEIDCRIRQQEAMLAGLAPETPAPGATDATDAVRKPPKKKR